MADDGIANTISLILDAAHFQKQISSNDGAFELEGHLGREQECIRCANVVERTGEVVCSVVVYPWWEMSLNERELCLVLRLLVSDLIVDMGD